VTCADTLMADRCDLFASLIRLHTARPRLSLLVLPTSFRRRAMRFMHKKERYPASYVKKKYKMRTRSSVPSQFPSAVIGQLTCRYV
jgi:hypothetical protein